MSTLEKSVKDHLERYFESLDGTPPADLHKTILKMVEKPLIEKCLDSTRGNRLKAAQILGINRNTLHKKIADLGVIYNKPGRAANAL